MTAAGLYGLLADAVLLLHAAFVLFVVGGLALILAGWVRSWCWTRGVLFRLAHLVAIGFVVLEAWFGVICPLTTLENALRVRAGAAGYGTGFIRYWVGKFLFYAAPEWVFTIVYTLFAAVVILTLILYPPRRKG